MNDLSGWFAALLGLLVAVSVAVVSVRTGAGTAVAPDPSPAPVGAEPERRRLAAVVINPTKFEDMDVVRGTLEQVCAERGWAAPLILETTEEDNGTGQAREAAEKGAEVVCALGGDGTVRAVAAGLIGGDVPLGLLPGGTGNLLARNLGLPIDDIAEAFRVALDGDDRRVDVGTLNVVVPGQTQEQPNDYYFLVMAGVGFDADVMAQAPEDLKAQMGWAAYVVSGAKNLNGDRFGISVAFDDGDAEHRRIRSVIIGNCGRLQGGVELLPDAEIDDGELDAVLLAPKGVVGWAGVGARVLTKQRKGHDMVEHHRCRTMMVSLDEPQEVQLDGDPIGPGLVLTAAVEPHALAVRVIPEAG